MGLVLPGLGSMWPAPQLSAGSSFPLQFLLTTLGSSLESAEQEEKERLAIMKDRHCASLLRSCVSGWRTILVSPQRTCPPPLRQHLSLVWNSPIKLDRLASQLQGPSFLCYTGLGVDSGFWTQVLVLLRQILYRPSHCFSPADIFLLQFFNFTTVLACVTALNVFRYDIYFLH